MLQMLNKYYELYELPFRKKNKRGDIRSTKRNRIFKMTFDKFNIITKLLGSGLHLLTVN